MRILLLLLVLFAVYGSAAYLWHAQHALDEQTQWTTLENLARQEDKTTEWMICTDYGCIVNEPTTAEEVAP